VIQLPVIYEELILPIKPFDGKMNILIRLLYVAAGIMLSSFAIIAAFIYYYAVRYLHLTPFILLLPTIAAELCLLYVNNEARVKYEKYFKELNPLWESLDEKSPKISMIAQFILVIATAILTLSLAIETFFFVYGILCLNLMLDYVTTTQRIVCVNIRCPYVINRVACLQCMKVKGGKRR
jgi:signal transduction histidine kinase